MKITKYKPNQVKNFAFLLIILLIFFVTLQSLFSFIKVNGIGGVTTPVQPIPLTYKNWISKVFQKRNEEFSKYTIGFKPHFIRVANQIEFSLFNDYKPGHVIIGKDDFLYELGYYNTVKNPIVLPADSIKKKIAVLNQFADYLSRLDKQLLLVIAPNKVRVLPENLPDELSSSIKDWNDNQLLPYIEKSKIPYIDFTPVFKAWKNSHDHEIITKLGTHWSMYGSVLAADSVFSYFNNKISPDLADIEIASIELSKKPRHTDADLNSLLNLLIDFKPNEMAYPILKKQKNKRKPKILTIGDSFFLSFIHNTTYSTCFSEESAFLYYYRNLYRNGIKTEEEINSETLKEEIEKSDIVLFCWSEPNLNYLFGEVYTDIERLLKEEKNGF